MSAKAVRRRRFRVSAPNTKRVKSKTAKRERLKIYQVTAQIYAGADGATVWEGTFDDIVAATRQRAEKTAEQRVIDSIPQYDERIQPGIRILSVQPAEPDPQRLAEHLVTRALEHGKSASERSHAIGDLQDVLRLCFETMRPGQIAEVLQHLREEQ